MRHARVTGWLLVALVAGARGLAGGLGRAGLRGHLVDAAGGQGASWRARSLGAACSKRRDMMTESENIPASATRLLANGRCNSNRVPWLSFGCQRPIDALEAGASHTGVM